MGKTRINYYFALIIFTVIYTNNVVVSNRHIINKRTIFSEPMKEFPGPEKNYTGIRVRLDSQLVVYHHEQTVGVVELGNNRELLNCELLEVRTKPDKIATLAILRNSVKKHIKIPFSDMNNLMQYCQLIGIPESLKTRLFKEVVRQASGTDAKGLSSIFQGVLPGTKWCGAGDLAMTYYDIGPEIELDKCCRTHDLCPVKVAGLRTQYNLTNYSPYTRSHCDCDDIFYRCLKNIGNKLSDLLGNLYFNIGRPNCVEDLVQGTKVIARQFTSRRKHF